MAVSLLPSNATALELAAEKAIATTFDLPVTIKDSWTPAICPATLLPWLAWAFSVDVWDDAWTDDRKRAVIDAAASVHRVKGTKGALHKALTELGMGKVTIREWFETGGDPYTFTVDAQTVLPLSDDLMNAAIRAIQATKNVRSHLAKVALAMAVDGAAPVFASALMAGEQGVVYPGIVTDATSIGGCFRASALQSAEYTTILPRAAAV